jgi:hypothetical protein
LDYDLETIHPISNLQFVVAELVFRGPTSIAKTPEHPGAEMTHSKIYEAGLLSFAKGKR